VLENIFQWQGATQHEVVFVFRAAALPGRHRCTDRLQRKPNSFGKI